MNVSEHPQTQPIKVTQFRTAAGLFLIFAGAVLFLDRYLRTGWLSLIILPIIGLFLYLSGVRMRHLALIISGSLISGAGAGLMAALGPSVNLGGAAPFSLAASLHPLVTQVGLLALYFGAGWIAITITAAVLSLGPAWWAMVPGGVIAGLGYCLLFTPTRWVDFALYIGLGVGVPLLLWGLITRLIGLIIPGCLLLGIGPGIYFAWQSTATGNGLSHTGIMLAWFALGWGLITISGQRLTHKFIWWPLIPGGILGVVGIGLYIGGDPTRALGFISNTGSIALMIFGLYLLLMRKGIHH